MANSRCIRIRARLSDERTPTPHACAYANGGFNVVRIIYAALRAGRVMIGVRVRMGPVGNVPATNNFACAVTTNTKN